MPQAKVWEADKFFGSYEGLEMMGWQDPDEVHLDDDAWKFQAAKLVESFALSSVTKVPRWNNSFQNPSLEFYDLAGHSGEKTTIFQTKVGEAYEHSTRYAWDEPDNTSTLDENYWQFARLRGDDAFASHGWEVLVKDGTVANAVTVTDRNGRIYAGAYNSTTVPINFDARYFAREALSTKYCFGARHTNAAGYLFRGFQGNDDTNPTAGIRANGTGEFSTLDVSDWPTLADEAAADTAGIPINSAYKTPTGELRFRLD